MNRNRIHRMIASSLLLLASGAGAVSGCGNPAIAGDSTWSCLCDCVICRDPFDCFDEENIIFNSIACADDGNVSEAASACNARCNQFPSDLGCGLVATPTEIQAHTCQLGSSLTALSSAARVLAVQSPIASAATVDPALSSVFFTLSDGSSGSTTLNGDIYIEGADCPGSTCDMTIPWMKLQPLDLDFGKHSEHAVHLLNNGNLAGTKLASDNFMLEPTTASFNGDGVLDGEFNSGAALAGAPVTGQINYASGTVSIIGTFQSTDGSIIIDLFLVAKFDNRAPIAAPGAAQSVACGTPVHLDGSQSHDPDGSITRYRWYTGFGTPQQQIIAAGESADVELPVGSHDVTLLVEDDKQRLGFRSTTVNVVAVPPQISCPSDETLQCTAGGAVSSFAPSVSGGCGAVTTTCAPPSGATLPNNSVTTEVCTVTDSLGAQASCSFTLAVHDTLGPVVTTSADARGFSATLWPPNHQYHTFSLADCVTSVTDQCDGALSIAQVGQITSVTSDEPEDSTGNGDGHTCNDVVIKNNTTFDLRAEREGGGDGRVYTVSFTVRDEAGNITAGSCKVQVPHDSSGSPAVNSGPELCVGSSCGSVPGHAADCMY